MHERVFNVRDFRAIGDGVADDTDAIQSVFDRVKEQGGAQVYFPAGTYLVDPLHVYDNTTITGDGSTSELKLKPQHLVADEHWAVLRMQGSKESRIKNVHISRIAIDGNKSAHTGQQGAFHECITWDWGRDSSISHVYIRNTTHNGIQIDGSRNVHIENVTVENADGWGIHLSDNGEGNERRTAECYVTGCRVTHSGYRKKRGGIDQGASSENNVYIGNICIANYRNYKILGRGATFFGNKSLGETKKRDDLSGVQVSVWPLIVLSKLKRMVVAYLKRFRQAARKQRWAILKLNLKLKS